MKTKAAVLALLLAASLANAQTQPQPAAPPALEPSVTGVVSSVSGHIVYVANGTVAIDATAAEIVDTAGAATSLAAVTPGSMIIASVKGDGIAANTPIVAWHIIATSKSTDVGLLGKLAGIDVVHNTFTILGKTLQVTPQTTFYGPGWDSKVRGLVDVKPNLFAIVQAKPGGTHSLVAKSIALFSDEEEPKELIHGTVKSIASDAWVIDDQPIAVIAKTTKIVGNPKVGDKVDVRGFFNSKGKPVAVTITKQ